MIKDIIAFFRHLRCKHETYRENLACNCICTTCGKDLGFIGSVDSRYPHARCIGYTPEVERAGGFR